MNNNSQEENFQIFQNTQTQKNNHFEKQYTEQILKIAQEQFLNSIKIFNKKNKSLEQIRKSIIQKEREYDICKEKLLIKRKLRNQQLEKRKLKNQQKLKQFQQIINSQQLRLKDLSYTLDLINKVKNDPKQYNLQQINKFSQFVNSKYDYLKGNYSKIKILNILKLENELLQNLNEIVSEMDYQQ